jgi:SH3-like domain-containing protein
MNMRSYGDWTRLLILTVLLGLAWSCAGPPVVKPPEGPFSVTPEITYLRDSPGYEGKVLGPLYKGDKVVRLDVGESVWWRVELQRSGEQGWVRRELLSPDPLATVFYYVKEDTLPLLECPRRDCTPLQVLFRGDQVQRVEAGDQGWWRVLVITSRSLGWVPAAALAERLEDTRQQQLRKPYYYVVVKKLVLRAKPSNHAEVVRTLSMNDQVEKIGETEGWFNVRQPASGAVGWVVSRYLETLPSIFPRGEPVKKKPRPAQQKAEPAPEPDFM